MHRTIHFCAVNTSMIICAYMQTKCMCLCIYAYLYHTDVIGQEWPYLVVCTVFTVSNNTCVKALGAGSRLHHVLNTLFIKSVKMASVFTPEKRKPIVAEEVRKSNCYRHKTVFPFSEFFSSYSILVKKFTHTTL